MTAMKTSLQLLTQERERECVCVFVCLCVCVCVCVWMHMFAWTHACACEWFYICICACPGEHTRPCTFERVHVYVQGSGVCMCVCVCRRGWVEDGRAGMDMYESACLHNTIWNEYAQQKKVFILTWRVSKMTTKKSHKTCNLRLKTMGTGTTSGSYSGNSENEEKTISLTVVLSSII